MSRRSSSLSPPRRRYRKRSRSRSSSSDSSSSRRRPPVGKAGTKRYLGDIVVHDHRTNQDELKSNDPALLACRVFIGNLPTDMMVKSDLEEWFKKYGKVIGCALFRGYGFVQFENEECARKSVEAEKGSKYKGFRLDVKMAAEGRRQSARRARTPPPRDAGYDAFRERSRDRSPLDDRRREPYRRDDPYDRALPDPRDDPYRRAPPPLHPEDPYLRAPLPPRDPYRRDPFAPPADPYYRDALPPPPFDRPAVPPPVAAGPERPPYDCVIVLHNRQQMGYAEMVERRMKQNMMAVDIQVLLENESSQVLIDGATRRNIPFAAVINHQNEVHQSITINILHGTPQEHRNMPLDDAMTLVTRNFEQFVKKLCEKEVGPLVKGGIVPPDSQLTYLLNLLADGRHLTLEELDKVKTFVDQRRNRMLEAEGKTPNGGPMDNQRNNAPPPVTNRAPVRPGAPLSQQLQPVSGQKDEVAIIKQQAELQAKILSILNTSSASPSPVPAPSRVVNNMQSQAHMTSGHAETQSVASNNRVPTLAGIRNQMPNQQQSGPPPGQQYGGNPPQTQRQQQQPQQHGGGSLPLNLDNPNIQKALDNLIQSGPSLIKSISNSQSGMSAGIQSAGMQARAHEQQMMNRHRGPPPPPPQNQMQRAPMQQQGMRMAAMQQQQQQQQQHMMQAQQQAVMQMNMMQMGMRPRF